MGEVQAMSPVAKVPLAKGAKVVALAVEHHDRVLTAGEHVDIVLRINSHTGAFVKGDARGQLAPALDILIAKVSDSVHFTHGASPFVADIDSARLRRTSQLGLLR